MARFSIGEFVVAGVAVVVLFTAAQARPIYTEPATPVVERLTHIAERDSLAARFPWAGVPTKLAMLSPRFEQDRRAFREDLLRTGNVEPERADSLATVAVREAYRRRVPPALVFGVMMVENPELKSRARSRVGAVGLMQIYPRAWVGSLGPHLGRDLHDDETNIRYGVYILGHLLYDNPDWLDADSILTRGLLRYNGCVRGSNTPGCQRYPDVVRSRIERLALSQCGDDGYDGCVANPLRLVTGDPALTW